MSHRLLVESGGDPGRLLANLVEHNVAATGIRDGEELHLTLLDDDGEMTGGLYGVAYLGCLEVRYLWVRAEARRHGHGRRLMATAERWAHRRRCGQVCLDTYSFQAPAFYEKLGYQVFGVLDGLAGQHSRYFMRKRLG